MLFLCQIHNNFSSTVYYSLSVVALIKSPLVLTQSWTFPSESDSGVASDARHPSDSHDTINSSDARDPTSDMSSDVGTTSSATSATSTSSSDKSYDKSRATYDQYDVVSRQTTAACETANGERLIENRSDFSTPDATTSYTTSSSHVTTSSCTTSQHGDDVGKRTSATSASRKLEKSRRVSSDASDDDPDNVVRRRPRSQLHQTASKRISYSGLELRPPQDTMQHETNTNIQQWHHRPEELIKGCCYYFAQVSWSCCMKKYNEIKIF